MSGSNSPRRYQHSKVTREARWHLHLPFSRLRCTSSTRFLDASTPHTGGKDRPLLQPHAVVEGPVAEGAAEDGRSLERPARRL